MLFFSGTRAGQVDYRLVKEVGKANRRYSALYKQYGDDGTISRVLEGSRDPIDRIIYQRITSQVDDVSTLFHREGMGATANVYRHAPRDIYFRARKALDLDAAQFDRAVYIELRDMAKRNATGYGMRTVSPVLDYVFNTNVDAIDESDALIVRDLYREAIENVLRGAASREQFTQYRKQVRIRDAKKEVERLRADKDAAYRSFEKAYNRRRGVREARATYRSTIRQYRAAVEYFKSIRG